MFLLLADAVLLFVIAARAIRERLVESLGWLTLSIGFVFMAMDEAWTIHEDLIGPIRQRLGAGHLGLLYNAWILPGIAVTGLIGLAYLRFLKALPRPTRIGFVLSAVIYLSGALGVEAIDGSYFEVHGNNFTYKVLTMVEEGLEMSGLILFCRYLLQYIRSQYDSIQFTFSDAVKEPKLKKVKDPATIRRIPGLEARPDERIILPAAHRRQTE
ncbi:MAG: multidrug transporter [Chitinophagaceae bacterium]|nr:MAG: multidrug transporter [Chitinophagaceae bacterium]